MVPAQPLAVLGAMTQGLLGSLLARSIDLLRGHGTAAALVTHVIVSEIWRDILAGEYGTQAEVVHNGVDVARFAAVDPALAAALRKRAGAESRPLILSVGGIEPRKGSDTLMKAVAELRKGGRRPVLAVVGGHSFQNYREYRDRVLASIPDLGLRLDDDVVLLGTVPDAELPGRYAAADVLAFPSTKEGWGLAVLEAMSAASRWSPPTCPSSASTCGRDGTP